MRSYKYALVALISAMVASKVTSFTGSSNSLCVSSRPRAFFRPAKFCSSRTVASASADDDAVVDVEIERATGDIKLDEETKNAIGNLVADDEWTGVTMELSELVKKAVIGA